MMMYDFVHKTHKEEQQRNILLVQTEFGEQENKYYIASATACRL